LQQHQLPKKQSLITLQGSKLSLTPGERSLHGFSSCIHGVVVGGGAAAEPAGARDGAGGTSPLFLNGDFVPFPELFSNPL